MSVGMVFYIIALILFFMVGTAMGPGTLLAWGFFSLTLGLLLSGVAVPWKPA